MKIYDFEMWKIGKKPQQISDLLHKLIQFASFTINVTFTTSSLILFCLVPMFHIRRLIKNDSLISKLLFSLFCLALPVYITVFFILCLSAIMDSSSSCITNDKFKQIYHILLYTVKSIFENELLGPLKGGPLGQLLVLKNTFINRPLAKCGSSESECLIANMF